MKHGNFENVKCNFLKPLILQENGNSSTVSLEMAANCTYSNRQYYAIFMSVKHSSV